MTKLEAIAAVMPIGYVTAWVATKQPIPKGFVVPYGQWLDESDYPEACAILKDHYGYNEETKQFRCPVACKLDLPELVKLTLDLPLDGLFHIMKVK